MNLDLLTREDLTNFKNEIFNEFKNYFKPIENDIWLKSADVKLLLGCSDSTLQKHRISGKLPYTKPGGTYYYKKTDVQNFLNKTRVQYGLA